MISVQLAAGIVTLMVIMVGVIHWRLELKIRQIRELEKNMEDARRELQSLEMLKTRFFGKIGDVLSQPLEAVEKASRNLGTAFPDLPLEVRNDLQNLSVEVHSLVRILTVFEQISSQGPGGENSEDLETVQLDELLSEAAMELSERAADKMVSVSLIIPGSVAVSGHRTQINEAVTSLLNQTLKRADPGTVLSVELKESNNIELEIRWSGTEGPGSGDESLLGTGLPRLIASSHGGWVSEDWKQGRITLNLPAAGEEK